VGIGKWRWSVVSRSVRNLILNALRHVIGQLRAVTVVCLRFWSFERNVELELQADAKK
jgi:hypothetical protein